jgi:hypothetical protein
MWMRVGRSRIDPSRSDEDSTLVADVAEVVKQLPGYHSHVFGVDRATGRGTSVMVFDTKEHADFPRSNEDLNARFKALGIQMDPPEFFEVTST